MKVKKNYKENELYKEIFLFLKSYRDFRYFHKIKILFHSSFMVVLFL